MLESADSALANIIRDTKARERLEHRLASGLAHWIIWGKLLYDQQNNLLNLEWIKIRSRTMKSIPHKKYILMALEPLQLEKVDRAIGICKKKDSNHWGCTNSEVDLFFEWLFYFSMRTVPDFLMAKGPAKYQGWKNFPDLIEIFRLRYMKNPNLSERRWVIDTETPSSSLSASACQQHFN